MFRLREIIRSGIIKEIREGAKVVVVDSDIAPFSWFGYVVISEKDYRENPQEIITHEIAHINYCHSIDVALCNLLIIFQWYNPAAWLIRRELQDVHEFEADEKVLEKGVDAKQYQMLLIKKSVGEHMFSMANNLNHNSLKKRIKMMKTEKTNRWHCIKAFALVPIVAIAVIAFANPKVEAMAIKAKAEGDAIFNALVPNGGTGKEESSAIVDDENSSEQVQLTAAAQPEEKGNDYSVVDEMPMFPGGMSKLIQYLQENIKYPAEAMNQGVQGRVITRFVVKTDGSIEDVKIVKSVDAQLDAEALRVVGAMPKWTPGKHDGKLVNVQYTLPIDFRLNKPSGAIEEGNVEKLKIVSDDKPVVVDSDSKKVVYYIDGKIAAEGVTNLNPDDIENITVLKGKAAAEKMGNSDCDGVIMIKTKKNK
jgi:TonB family protein